MLCSLDSIHTARASNCQTSDAMRLFQCTGQTNWTNHVFGAFARNLKHGSWNKQWRVMAQRFQHLSCTAQRHAHHQCGQGANNAAGARSKRFPAGFPTHVGFPTRGSPRAWGSSFVARHPSHFKAASENVWPGQASGWQSAEGTLFAGVPRLTRDLSQTLITCRRGRCRVGLSVRHGVHREGVRCRWLRGRTHTRAGVGVTSERDTGPRLRRHQR